MDISQLATLGVLALIDSTSIGTLVIPLLMILTVRAVRSRSIALYLLTVAAFYLLVGIAIMLGATALANRVAGAFDTRIAIWSQLAIGVILFAASWKMGGKNADPERVKRLIARGTQPGAIVSIALTATVLELATMVPYLAAIGTLTASDLNVPMRVGILALYCLVMIAPATLIVAVFRALGGRFRPQLARFADWIQRQVEETMAWLVGIAGFFIVANAIARLNLG